MKEREYLKELGKKITDSSVRKEIVNEYEAHDQHEYLHSLFRLIHNFCLSFFIHAYYPRSNVSLHIRLLSKI